MRTNIADPDNPETLTTNDMPDHRVRFWERTFRIYYVNAMVTSMEAGGHTKAEMNERQAKTWAKKIREFGGRVPTIKEVVRWGQFNGEGSV